MIRLNQNKRKFQSMLIFKEKIGFIFIRTGFIFIRTYFELRETIRLYKTEKTI